MNRRRFLALCGASGMVQACRSSGAAERAKFGMSTPADLVHNGAFAWAYAFAEAMGPAGIAVTVYPNSTLGRERERIIQSQMGLLEVNETGGDEIARWSPLAAAAARPFLIGGYDHADRLYEQTPFLEHVSADLRRNGLRLLDFAHIGSMVGLFTRGLPVRTLSDLRKLRLRVLSASDVDLLNAWQVRGVQVAWEEVAQALQTGMVDAYLNPPHIAPMFGHSTVLDYFTDLNLGPASRAIVCSNVWYETLTASQKETFGVAVAAGRKANREWISRSLEQDRARLRATGIEWITLTPRERLEWLDASSAIPTSRWETEDARAQYREWVEQTREAP